MSAISRYKLATDDEHNANIALSQFVANFLRYITAKYHFELVYSWKSYPKHKKLTFYWDTVQCGRSSNVWC